MEVLLSTMFLDISKVTGGDGAFERKVRGIFIVCKDALAMGAGLRVFLKGKVSKAALLKRSRERRIVREGCKQASKILMKLRTAAEYDDDVEVEDVAPHAQA